MAYYDHLGKVSVTVDGNTFDAVAASFRGAFFFVKNNAQGGGGRKVQVNKLAASDEWVCTDLGGNVPTLSMNFYLVGEDCDNAKNELIKACGLEGEGKLIHPWLGTFDARCVSLDFEFGFEAMGFIRGKITFQQEGLLPEKTVVVDNRGETKTKAKSFKEKAMELMESAYAVADLGKQALADVVDISNDALDVVFEARKSLQVAAGFVGEVDRLKANIEVLIATPGDFAKRVSDLVSATGDLFGIDDDDKVSVEEYLALMNMGVDLSKDYTGSGRALVGLIQNTAASMVLSSIVDCEFDSVDEALEIQQRISAAFDKMFEGVDDVESFMRLSDMQAAAMSYLREVMANTAVILEKDVESTTNVLQLCYDVYGNIDRVDEIIARNFMQQGMFVMPGKVKVRSK